MERLRRLQAEVFGATSDKVVAVLSVTTSAGAKKKLGKKGNKPNLLCATVRDRTAPHVHRLKASGATFKKKETWPLQDLRSIDGRSENEENAEFVLVFGDRPTKWRASSVTERNAFLAVLFKLCGVLTGARPTLKNINMDKLHGFVETSKAIASGAEAEGAVDAVAAAYVDDYRELTAQEEADVVTLITSCDWAIHDAEAFAEHLTGELHALDGANIHAILESEAQVERLMHYLDKAAGELSRVEGVLSGYERLLTKTRREVEQMERTHEQNQTQSENHGRLVTELAGLLTALDMPAWVTEALDKGDLTHPASLSKCIAGSQLLRAALDTKMRPELAQLDAVRASRDHFETIQRVFLGRVVSHFQQLFTRRGGEGSDSLGSHVHRHRNFLAYAQLAEWLRQTDAAQFDSLRMEYSRNLNKAYRQDVRDLIERLRGFAKSGGWSFGDGAEAQATAIPESHSVGDLAGGSSGGDKEYAKIKFEQAFEQLLSQLIPAMIGEQDFCAEFFGLDVSENSAPPASFASVSALVASALQASPGSPPSSPKRLSGMRSPWTAVKSKLSDIAQKDSPTPANDKSKSDADARKMMAVVFNGIEGDLIGVIELGDKADHLYQPSASSCIAASSVCLSRSVWSFLAMRKDANDFTARLAFAPFCTFCHFVSLSHSPGSNSLCMMVKIDHYLGLVKGKSGFMSAMLGKFQIIVKRNFDLFISEQQQLIRDARASKKKYAGILPFVRKFPAFVSHAETIVVGWERRALIEQAYLDMSETIVKGIQQQALEAKHGDVLRFENFHHLYTQLSFLKVACLDGFRKDTQRLYREHLQSYVLGILGSPLEKLSKFFEGVQRLVDSGVKEDEVGYQLAFSKQELKKVIREYPAKEVCR
eukprot:Opistho-2@90539